MLQIKYLHKKFATIIMSWPNVKHTLIDFQECLYMKHTACDCESNCSSSLFDFSIILIRNNTWIFMTYQYGVPINDFLLHMVWVIWAETPKSAVNINIDFWSQMHQATMIITTKFTSDFIRMGQMYRKGSQT